jgi:hypothetical protein
VEGLLEIFKFPLLNLFVLVFFFIYIYISHWLILEGGREMDDRGEIGLVYRLDVFILNVKLVYMHCTYLCIAQ